MSTQVHTKKATAAAEAVGAVYADSKSAQFKAQASSQPSAGVSPDIKLNDHLQRAKHFGHNLNQIQIVSKVSRTSPAQTKPNLLIQPQVVDEEQGQDEDMEAEMRGTQMKVGQALLAPVQRLFTPEPSSDDTGRSLPKDVQAKMEKSFNTSFSDVQVYEGSKAKSVGALAYTQGNRIHFASGQYNPHSPAGQALLGHELTHVVQQRAGRVAVPAQHKGLPINADPALEQEADEMGAKAARGELADVPGANFGGSLLQKRQPMQNSQMPVQFFIGALIGPLINALMGPVMNILLPQAGGGGGGGGDEGGGDDG